MGSALEVFQVDPAAWMVSEVRTHSLLTARRFPDKERRAALHRLVGAAEADLVLEAQAVVGQEVVAPAVADPVAPAEVVPVALGGSTAREREDPAVRTRRPSAIDVHSSAASITVT